MQAHLRAHKAEAVTIAGMLLVYAIVLVGTVQLSADSGLFPRIIGFFGLVVMAVVALRFLRGGAEIVDDDELLTTTKRKRLVALISPPAYGAVFYIFGFYVSAGIAIGAVPWMLGYRKPVALLLLGIGTVAVLSLLFSTVLNVPIPHGVVGEWFMRRYVYLD